MIPTGASIQEVDVVEEEQPSLTWGLDLLAGRVVGRIDGLAAVKQAVAKSLQTARFRHLIYSANYGNELESLIGKNPALARSEANRMIQEAMTQDDRILDVQDVQIDMAGDQLTVGCTVVTRYGSFRLRQEVMPGV